MQIGKRGHSARMHKGKQGGADVWLTVGQNYCLLLINNALHSMRMGMRGHSPRLHEGKQGGGQVEAEDQLALLHIQALLCHSCGDDNVQLPGLHLLQHVVLGLQQTIYRL